MTAETPARPSTREAAAALLGLGVGFPELSIDHDAAAGYAKQFSCVNQTQHRALDVLYRRSGIDRRGSVLLEGRDGTEGGDGSGVGQSFFPPANSESDRGPTTGSRNARYEREAPRLALEASAAALRDSGVPAESITELVTVSCTGSAAPGVDIALIDGLGLSPRTERVQLGFMGCHAAINALRAGRGLIAARPGGRVLICCVELCSLHYQYGFDPERIVSNAIFADGAAAVVLGEPPAVGPTSPPPSDPTKPFALAPGYVSATGSRLVADTRDAMTWRIGDHGYEMGLSPAVPDLIRAELRPFVEEWLECQGESLRGIGGWAVHPGGTRILSAVEQSLGLDPEALEIPRSVLREHGNMSSATMLIILDRFVRAAQPKPWVMLGFGPGLVMEIALIRELAAVG